MPERQIGRLSKLRNVGPGVLAGQEVCAVYATINNWLQAPDPNGPITCATCGCRLTEANDDGTMWRHFSSMHPGRDARGCRPACVDQLHGRDGFGLEMSREPIPFAIEAAMDEPMLGREDAAAA